MYNFTDSPLEKTMKQPPRPRPEIMRQPPQGSSCCGCSFWQGATCVGICYRELLAKPKKEEAF